MRRALHSSGRTASAAAILIFAGCSPQSAAAAVLVVKTAPWVANKPGIPHETCPGRSITLKGITNQDGHNFYAKWRFGDGTPDAIFVVTDPYDVSTTHTYAGTAGKRWTATLTVTDAETGETAGAEYPVVMREDNLACRVNVAIDEGLWYLHRTLQRHTPVTAQGDWDNLPPSSCNAGDQACDNRNNSPAINASNVLAFEVNGHLENGREDNPYKDDVARVLARMFTQLVAVAIPDRKACPGKSCSFNPDRNGNGLAVFVQSGQSAAQGFDPTVQFIDAIVASGTPAAKVMAGPENIAGRTYKEIVQDLVDGYSYCRFSPTSEGPCQKGSAQGAARWAKTGLAAATRSFGIAVPPEVLEADQAAMPSGMAATPADRYAIEVSNGTPAETVIRSLVDSRNPIGFWTGREQASSDRPYETGWSIIMLRRGSLAANR